MNEQINKKIIFNKSTLFNLKAELLRKQEEVQEKKQQPQHKVEFHRPLPATPAYSDDDPKTKKRSFKDSLRAVDMEELEACRKAKLALEKKAELYDHLSDDVGNSQLAERFLVDFNSKKQQNVEVCKALEVDDNQFEPENDDDDSEWTEFTDCLGRTRKCHKSDLESYKEKDRELMRAITKDKPANKVQVSPEVSKAPKSEKPLLVQKTNDYLQSLREKWEQKERELLAKDKDIHYQDLLFDEARMHGVAYYSFSTDDAERQKQIEELKRRREETMKAQRETEELRRKRDETMAARVAAARARQRARAGLSPEEPEEPKKDFTKCLLELLTKQKAEADAKAKENEKKIREEKEKERQKLRESYIREWDVGKEGVGAKEVKAFREMTQEEYVEQQRAKRIDEFAPPQTSTRSRSNYMFDNLCNLSGENSSDVVSTNKTWAEVRAKSKTPPPEINEIIEPKGLYFTSSKKPASSMKYKNFVKSQELIPIINELNENEINVGKGGKKKFEEKKVEVPPPPTYDYYGPVPKHSKSAKPFDFNITEAYAQGTKSLEAKESNRKIMRHYDFTFD